GVIVEVDQLDSYTVFHFTRSELVEGRTPVAILSEIIRGALGEQNVAGITAIHHPFGHVDAEPGDVGAIVYIYRSTNRTGVNAHPQSQTRLTCEGCTDLQSASNRCLRSIEEYQRHSVARGKSDQFFLRLCFTEFGGTPDDVVQFLEQGPLLINEQFRVTNHVYEQNRSDAKLEIRSSFRGHVGNRARRRVQHCQTVGASRAETKRNGASGIKAAFAEGQEKILNGPSSPRRVFD